MSKARDIADLDFNSPDIDGGNIDGAIIGASTAAAATVSTFTVGDSLFLQPDGNNDLLKSTGGVLYLKANEYSFQNNSGNEWLSFNSSGNATFSGNVGIGQSPTSFSGWQVLDIKGGSDGAMVNFEDAASTRLGAVAMDTDNALRIQTFTSGTSDIKFEPNNAVALTLDSNQNATFNNRLGVGVTAQSDSPLLISHNGHGIGVGYIGSSLPNHAGIYTSSDADNGQAYGSLIVQARADYSGYGIQLRASNNKLADWTATQVVYNGGNQNYSDTYRHYAHIENVSSLFNNTTNGQAQTITVNNYLPYQHILPVVVAFTFNGNGAISYSKTLLVENGFNNIMLTTLATNDSDGGSIMSSVSFNATGAYNTRRLQITATPGASYSMSNWNCTVYYGIAWH